MRFRIVHFVGSPARQATLVSLPLGLLRAITALARIARQLAVNASFPVDNR